MQEKEVKTVDMSHIECPHRQPLREIILHTWIFLNYPDVTIRLEKSPRFYWIEFEFIDVSLVIDFEKFHNHFLNPDLREVIFEAVDNFFVEFGENGNMIRIKIDKSEL